MHFKPFGFLLPGNSQTAMFRTLSLTSGEGMGVPLFPYHHQLHRFFSAAISLSEGKNWTMRSHCEVKFIFKLLSWSFCPKSIEHGGPNKNPVEHFCNLSIFCIISNSEMKLSVWLLLWRPSRSQCSLLSLNSIECLWRMLFVYLLVCRVRGSCEL